MIAKGNTHDNGVRLARYLTTGKDGELAHLWELRGFALRDITSAFRSIHVMAEKGQGRQPFFHVQVRNPPGECLTRDQWFVAIDRIERAIGLADQPRAIAAHLDTKTGDEHVHVAWSRIDPDTLRTKSLPFFKFRLKRVSRELESDLGLTPVPNERPTRVRYAPKRTEEQQAIRLKLPIHDIRETIKSCFERSDNGHSLKAALRGVGLQLARGERRDYVVVDHEGGVHAMGKRLLGVTAAELRSRLADLVPPDVPTVSEVRQDLVRKKVSDEPPIAPILNAHSPDYAQTIRAPQTANSETKKSRALGKEVRAVRAERRSVKAIPTPGHETGPSDPKLGSDERPPAYEPGVALLSDAPPKAPYSTADIDGEAASSRRHSGTAARLKKQFGLLMKALTHRGTSRPRSRRRREETRGGFRLAAAKLVQWVHRLPWDIKPGDWEPFAWLTMWDVNTAPLLHFHQDRDQLLASQSFNL